ncbi:MAG: peptide ABC transporter ATP-binding protein [Dehalococcoidia bacterium]|nr:peptide ABC transporter ATP-binding protein [Dehalococcoidia bacterium]
MTTTTAPAAGPKKRQPIPPVLEIDDLHIQYESAGHAVQAVRGVSLSIRRGETLGIVGESGCGKSTMAFAVMRYLGASGRIVRGDIRLGGRSLIDLSESQLRELRGKRIAMVYQDPQSALNPAMAVGEQVAEAFCEHEHASREAGRSRALELFRRVGLPDPERIARRYPHQLSGGQQQRVVIALGLVCSPELLILDEPTTGLDVTTEATILDLVNDLKREYNSAVLFISHNLGVIAQVCDRVAVMYAGEVVESCAAGELFLHPSQPYTAGLLGCVPRLSGDTGDRLNAIPGSLPPPHMRLPGCAFAPRCRLARAKCVEVAPELEWVTDDHRSRCHFWEESPTLLSRPPADSPSASSASPDAIPAAPSDEQPSLLEVSELSHYYSYHRPSGSHLGRAWHTIWRRQQRPVKAVEKVSLRVGAGETVALVGESGCGKSTLGSVIAGLLSPTFGTVAFEGQDISVTVRQRDPALQRSMQMVFQNPEASLNPRHAVGRILTRPLELFNGLKGAAARRQAEILLASVNLDASYYDRYPSQLSGGEKQRVAIARAFAGDRKLVICDEPVSALDVSVQAAVLNLLKDLQDEKGTAYLFVSHDLAVVRHLANRIVVMYLGEVMEQGGTEALFHPPYHPYTEALLAAVPVPDPRVQRQHIRLEGPVPSAMDRPPGCPFHTRCPRKIGSICEDEPPPLVDAAEGHTIRCHIPVEGLAAFPPVIQSAAPSSGDTVPTPQGGGRGMRSYGQDDGPVVRSTCPCLPSDWRCRLPRQVDNALALPLPRSTASRRDEACESAAQTGGNPSGLCATRTSAAYGWPCCHPIWPGAWRTLR